jgi:hypothetical protein
MHHPVHQLHEKSHDMHVAFLLTWPIWGKKKGLVTEAFLSE